MNNIKDLAFVFLVNAIIWIGLFIYLLRLDRKIKHLQEELHHEEE